MLFVCILLLLVPSHPRSCHLRNILDIVVVFMGVADLATELSALAQSGEKDDSFLSNFSVLILGSVNLFLFVATGDASSVARGQGTINR